MCGYECHCTPGNSSNIKEKHRCCFKDEEVSDAAASQGRAGGGGWYTVNNKTARRMLKLKILFVCVCVYNYVHANMARSDIFSQWTYEMEQNFSAPHKLMFGRIVLVLYTYIKRKITARLEQVSVLYNRVPYACASLDHWTSKHSKLGFAALDTQFTAPDTARIESYTLHIGHMPGSHTAEATTQFVKDVMPLYGFVTACQLFFMACSDGGANAFNAMVALNLVYGVLYCYCHRMHLSIKRALGQYGSPVVNEPVAKLFAKWRAVLGHFTRSPLNMGRLLALQIQAGKKAHQAVRVFMDMVVRWLSTANALERSMLLQSVIVAFFHEHDPGFVHQLGPLEWKALRGIHAVIEFGHGASTVLQTESLSVIAISWLTISLFARHAVNVRRQLSSVDATKYENTAQHLLHPYAKRVGKALKKDLDKRFGADKITDIEKIAMVLDPRTKDLRASWCPFGPAEKEECWALADVLVRKLAVAPVPEAPVEADVMPTHEDFLDDAYATLIMDDEPEDAVGDGDGNSLHPELQDWRTNGVCVGTACMLKFDPLKFHHGRCDTSPVVSAAAKLVLGGMAAAARVEQTWPVGGHVLDDLANRLSPELLCMLIYIKRNWDVLLIEVTRTEPSPNPNPSHSLNPNCSPATGPMCFN